MMNINSFRDVFLPVLERAARALSQISPDGKSYKELTAVCHFEPPGRFKLKEELVVPYETVAFWVRHKIQSSQQFKDCVSALESDPEISKHVRQTFGSRFSRHRIQGNLLIQNVLQTYLKKKQSFARDSRLVRRLFDRMKTHFAGELLQTQFRAYLENIHFGPKKVRLSPETQVLSLTEEDVVELYNSKQYFREFYSDKRWIKDLGKVRAAIVVIFSEHKTFGDRIPKADGDPRDIGRREIYKVVHALRLRAPSPVCVSPIVEKTAFYPFENHEFQRGQNEYQYYESQTSFDVLSVPLLSRIFGRLDAAEEDYPALKHVWNRLDLFNSRRVYEDRVIDLFICLEYMVRMCVPEERSEDVWTNAKSIALFLVNLVGKDKKDKDLVYNTVLEAYQIRNRIVHAKESREPEYATVQQLARIIRAGLMHIILQE